MGDNYDDDWDTDSDNEENDPDALERKRDLMRNSAEAFEKARSNTNTHTNTPASSPTSSPRGSAREEAATLSAELQTSIIGLLKEAGITASFNKFQKLTIQNLDAGASGRVKPILSESGLGSPFDPEKVQEIINSPEKQQQLIDKVKAAKAGNANENEPLAASNDASTSNSPSNTATPPPASPVVARVPSPPPKAPGEPVENLADTAAKALRELRANMGMGELENVDVDDPDDEWDPDEAAKPDEAKGTTKEGAPPPPPPPAVVTPPPSPLLPVAKAPTPEPQEEKVPEIKSEHLDTLFWQTEGKIWSANATQTHVMTNVMTEREAQYLAESLNPNLQAQVQKSKSQNGYRVMISNDNLTAVIDNKEELLSEGYSAQLNLRSVVAQNVHGKGPIYFNRQNWKQVTSEVDFAKEKDRHLVSLGSSQTRERLFIDLQSETINKLYNDIAKQCQGKTPEEILKIVNKEIDKITAPEGSNREQIERQLDARLDKYLDDREKGLKPPNPRNRDVQIDELMQEGILVCRHKGLLAGAMMGRLVQNKLLPEGSTRQYRSDIQDSKGNAIGAHCWSVYREAQSGKLWVNDPRWAHVVQVTGTPENALQIGYGVPAIKMMVERLDKLDASVSPPVKAKLERAAGQPQQNNPAAAAPPPPPPPPAAGAPQQNPAAAAPPPPPPPPAAGAPQQNPAAAAPPPPPPPPAAGAPQQNPAAAAPPPLPIAPDARDATVGLTDTQKAKLEEFKKGLKTHLEKQGAAEQKADAAAPKDFKDLWVDNMKDMWKQTKSTFTDATPPKDEYEAFAQLFLLIMQMFAQLTSPASAAIKAGLDKAWGNIKQEFYERQAKKQGDNYNNIEKQEQRLADLDKQIEESQTKIASGKLSEHQLKFENAKLSVLQDVRSQTEAHINELRVAQNNPDALAVQLQNAPSPPDAVDELEDLIVANAAPEPAPQPQPVAAVAPNPAGPGAVPPPPPPPFKFPGNKDELFQVAQVIASAVKNNKPLPAGWPPNIKALDDMAKNKGGVPGVSQADFYDIIEAAQRPTRPTPLPPVGSPASGPLPGSQPLPAGVLPPPLATPTPVPAQPIPVAPLPQPKVAPAVAPPAMTDATAQELYNLILQNNPRSNEQLKQKLNGPPPLDPNLAFIGKASLLNVANAFGNKEAYNILKAAGADEGFARRIDLTKQFGNVVKLKENSANVPDSIKLKNGTTIQVNTRADFYNPQAGFALFHQQYRQHTQNHASEPSAQTMSNMLEFTQKNGWSPNRKQAYLSRLNDQPNLPTLIPSGTTGHNVGVIIYKDKMIVATGSGAKPSPIEIHNIKRPINEAQIQALLDAASSNNKEAYREAINNISKGVEYYPGKPQKTNNCSYINFVGAAEGLAYVQHIERPNFNKKSAIEAATVQRKIFTDASKNASISNMANAFKSADPSEKQHAMTLVSKFIEKYRIKANDPHVPEDRRGIGKKANRRLEKLLDALPPLERNQLLREHPLPPLSPLAIREGAIQLGPKLPPPPPQSPPPGPQPVQAPAARVAPLPQPPMPMPARGAGPNTIKPFSVTYTGRSAQQQADQIIAKFREEIANGKKVAITYSANNDQANDIYRGYSGAPYAIKGRGQAKVMHLVAQQIQADPVLKANAHILPVATSMHKGGDGQVNKAIMDRDLGNIAQHLGNGYTVLGYQNEDSGNGYAVGGMNSRQVWDVTPNKEYFDQRMAGMTRGEFTPELQQAYNSGKTRPSITSGPLPPPPPRTVGQTAPVPPANLPPPPNDVGRAALDVASPPVTPMRDHPPRIPVAHDPSQTVDELFRKLQENKDNLQAKTNVESFKKVEAAAGQSAHVSISMYTTPDKDPSKITEVKAETKPGTSGVTMSIKNNLSDDQRKQTIQQICDMAVLTAKPGAVLDIPVRDGPKRKEVEDALKQSLEKAGIPAEALKDGKVTIPQKPRAPTLGGNRDGG